MLEHADVDACKTLLAQAPTEQAIPVVGLPVLVDRQQNRTLSQAPAIVHYLAHELDLAPSDPFELALSTKVLMDCNDLLMEICRYNGSFMWERETWQPFRTDRLVHWMQVFEQSLNRGHFGQSTVTFADTSVFALFGNMTRCLPELAPDLKQHAPGVHQFCQAFGAQPSIAQCVAWQQEQYGSLYCGGQIEQSIRKMLAADAA